MHIKKKIPPYVFSILLLSLFFNLNTTYAVEPLLNNIACIENGDCQLNDFVALAINVSNFILGIVGSLALLAFVYGGFLWLTSAGVSERVNKGKQVIIGAIIGLFIVFGSFTIISFVTDKLDLEEQGPFKAGWDS